MQTKNAKKVMIANLLAGLEKHFKSNDRITLNGQSLKCVDVVATLTLVAACIAATALAKAAHVAAVEKERETWNGKGSSTVIYLRRFLMLTFGETNPVLADFGITPRKPRQPTVEVKAAAIAKARATRAARHTMGKRQRLAIEGSSPGAALPKASNGTNGSAPS